MRRCGRKFSSKLHSPSRQSEIPKLQEPATGGQAPRLSGWFRKMGGTVCFSEVSQLLSPPNPESAFGFQNSWKQMRRGVNPSFCTDTWLPKFYGSSLVLLARPTKDHKLQVFPKGLPLRSLTRTLLCLYILCEDLVPVLEPHFPKQVRCAMFTPQVPNFCHNYCHTVYALTPLLDYKFCWAGSPNT